ALGTAQKCCEVMGLDARQIQRKKPLYLASLSVLKAQLAACPPEAQRVMLVGHNPGLERLLRYLCAKTRDLPEKGQLLPTGALAYLAMPDDWRDIPQGGASLLRVQRAAKLPKRFPFPGLHGSERRNRPAYYYTQSAVIPYRIRDGNLEILMVRSSRDKHWVVPKGIIDPGHSAQESALKEAWEEAGIEGEVDDQPLGSYRYPKWGAFCSVTVYPMAVSREIPVEEWEEPERGRHWVSAEMASKLLKQKGLRPLVQTLALRLGTVS
ncbi:MAG: NUDIX domain-containing protein, partial [Sedimenticolaceae bacterium]